MTLTELTEYVADLAANADGLPAGTVVVRTAGQPADPLPTACPHTPRVSVWWSTLVNSATQTGPAIGYVRSQAEISFLVSVCYHDSDLTRDIPPAEHEDAADRLEELAQAVWCAVVNDDGPDNCSVWRPTGMRVQPRQGGIVSALGGVTVDHTCDTIEP